MHRFTAESILIADLVRITKSALIVIEALGWALEHTYTNHRFWMDADLQDGAYADLVAARACLDALDDMLHRAAVEPQ